MFFIKIFGTDVFGTADVFVEVAEKIDMVCPDGVIRYIVAVSSANLH